jgi:GNAT superfamily N-acetyltransferase
MPILAPAEGPLLEQILDASYDLWNEGLTRSAYGRWWKAQLGVPWASSRLTRTALVEGSAVLASAKTYCFDAVLDGRPIGVIGVGAVFTQPAYRGRGYARELLERLLARAADQGTDAACLFSEIGTDYYRRLGFTTVPKRATVLRVSDPARRGAPATLVRAGVDADIDAVVDINRERAAAFRFHLERDQDLIRFSVAKKRLLAGLSAPSTRELQFFVAEEGAKAVAYVVASVRPAARPAKWMIEECGDRDPSGARVGAILQALLARDPSAERPDIRAWLPADFNPPQVAVVDSRPVEQAMMVRPLGNRASPITTLREEDVLYWHGDAF